MPGRNVHARNPSSSMRAPRTGEEKGVTLRLIGEDDTGLSRVFDKGLMCDLNAVPFASAPDIRERILFTARRGSRWHCYFEIGFDIVIPSVQNGRA